MAQGQPLSVLVRTLIDSDYQPPLTYDVVYRASLNALIPVERGPNGRWTFNPADVPVIAERLGLTITRAAG